MVTNSEPTGAIAGRLATVRGRLAAACLRAGRKPSAVTLVAVSKTRPIEDLHAAAAVGQVDFGENRVQEASQKHAAGLPKGTVLHLVGSLQKNKARAAAGLFDLIHSVDDIELLRRLDRAATGPLGVLLEVKLAAERTKGGVGEEGLELLLAAAEPLARVQVRGLMLLPPFALDPEASRPYFRRLVLLRDRLGGPARLPELSMGMSLDFEVAIEEGATIVRVGQAIFGRRG